MTIEQQLEEARAEVERLKQHLAEVQREAQERITEMRLELDRSDTE